MTPDPGKPTSTIVAPADPVSGEMLTMPADGHAPSSRAAAVNALAMLVVAAGTAIQVAMYLRDFGATQRTDGFIAAFAIYSLVVVLGQLLRTTAVPLLSGARPDLSQRAFAWAIVVLALVLAIPCAALAAPLGDVVARASGSAGRSIAVTSLYVLAPAMGLQVLGSGLAVKGAVEARVEAVAYAYMVSSIVGVIAFFSLRHAADETVIAWAMLASSATLVVGQWLGTRARYRRPPSPREVRTAIIRILHTLPLPASFVAMYPVTLALLPNDRPGAITLFGLGYGACSYLIGFTGQALSMTDSVTLAGLDADANERRRSVVSRAFRYSVLLAAPGIGVAAVVGSPILGALLPAPSSGAHGLFADDVLLMIPWLIGMLAFWATLPALLSARSERRSARGNVGVIALLVLHVAAVLVGRGIDGFDGAILAMSVAPLAFVAFATRRALRPVGLEFVRTAGLVVVIAGVSFGLPALAYETLTSAGPALGVLAASIGGVLYLAIAATAFPDTAQAFTGLLRRA